jgi:hypothetical protein
MLQLIFTSIASYSFSFFLFFPLINYLLEQKYVIIISGVKFVLVR